jgi:tetratricopeptide (TPR) repeat protein
MARICCAVVLALLVGCSQSYLGTGRSQLNQGEYDKAIENFYKEIQVNPTSTAAWRNLGIAFFKQGNMTKAEDALMQANNIRPEAETELFMGLVQEKQGNVDKAISSYSNALSLGAGGKTEETIRGRLNALLAEKMKREVDHALAAEDSINVANIPENTIAVSDFDGSDLSPDLQPIAKGLAELTSIDLSKVSQLQVLERQKLNILEREIQLGRSGKVDVSTAPRVGRLLGSRRVVTGKIIPYGENNEDIRLDGVLINTADSSVNKEAEQEGQLKKFFEIQKAFVFGLLKSMNIQLTQAERDSIEVVPTESLLAFLAYSRGLDYESRGLYDQARVQFHDAVAHDAGFQAAQTQLKTATSAGLSTSGSLESFETEVFATSGTTPETGGNELGSFQQSTIINGGFVPSGGGSDNSPPPIQPPVVGNTGHVIVRGSVDAQ